MQTLPAPLQPFAAWVRFVVWFATPDMDRPGKTKKLAVNWQTGAVVDPLDPTAWTTADQALAAAPGWNRGHGSGAGFVFCTDDPFFFLDIDNCLQPDGQWSPTALDMCNRFAGAAVEVSQSGRGLHIFGRYTSVDPHGTRCKPLGLELYTRGRFVALTGLHAAGDAATDHTAALSVLIAQHFPPTALTSGTAEWTTEPVAEWRGPDDDDELMRRALAAAGRSAAAKFGGSQTLIDLWTGNVSDDERSESDQKLACHLAFWTGKNCERIERLMRMSGLVREKWDSPHHANYLTNTILKGCIQVDKVYVEAERPAPVETAAIAPGESIKRTGEHEYLSGPQQRQHFAGCHYVHSLNKIFSVSRNVFLAQSGFNVEYGGHIFMLDATSTRKTDSAWEAFTQSTVNPPSIADGVCFRPELPPGTIVHEGVRTYINTYVPYDAPETAGDPSIFLDHMTRLFPDERDRLIILHYMAAMVQHPGVKFQWWPVIQGTRGNGKTLLCNIMTYCVGEQYTHLPNAHALARDGMKFNSWLERKLFIGIEEVRLTGKREFLDEFKIVVTNKRMAMEGKGVDGTTGDNRANGILFTNHPDGVPIDAEENRYAVFFTAQQTKADVLRDGMDEAYFTRLHNWLDNGGMAICRHFLRHMPLDAAMNPARGSRAPETTSRDAAIALSYGRIEQEVLEAIDEQKPGFAGGWVSSHFLDMLIEKTRVYLPRQKRRAMMQTLGYDYHPALREGRVNNAVMPDNAKPRLYVRTNDGALLQMRAVAEIEKAYSAAQTPGAMASPPAVVLAFEKPA